MEQYLLVYFQKAGEIYNGALVKVLYPDWEEVWKEPLKCSFA